MAIQHLPALGARVLQRLTRMVRQRKPRSPLPTSHEAAVIQAMTEHNMVTQPDESYYAQQYLRWILPELTVRFADRRVHIVDLGCGHGRLSIPLAEWCAAGGGQVIGVDLTPAAVDQARRHAATRRLTNVVFRESDVL